MKRRVLTHGSLFAGIGGFDLGFERAGINTLWQVELDPFCRKVLEKNFLGAQRFIDVRECCGLSYEDHTAGVKFAGKCQYPHHLSKVDIVTGGFPCQDISNAGKRVGIDGERSGLWSEMRRIICELRPQFVVVENVSALLQRGIERVLGDLAESGFDSEWDCIPASAIGAPHRRDRIWILAYPMRGSGSPEPGQQQSERAAVTDSGCAGDVADAQGSEVGTRLSEIQARTWEESSDRFGNGNADYRRHWSVEPNVGRVAHGIPARVDRLKGLGNSLVPQIAEWIGRRIVACHEQATGVPGRLTR